MRRIVDLPQPEGPTRATSSPRRTSRSRPPDRDRAVRVLLADAGQADHRPLVRRGPGDGRGGARAGSVRGVTWAVHAQSVAESCLQRNAWVCPEYVRTRSDILLDGTVEHLGLTFAAVALGLVVALPLGVLASRSQAVETGASSIATVLYTIPSLAMFPLLLAGGAAVRAEHRRGRPGDLHARRSCCGTSSSGCAGSPRTRSTRPTGMGLSARAAAVERRAAARPAGHPRRGADRHRVHRRPRHRGRAVRLRRARQPHHHTGSGPSSTPRC